MVRVKQNPKKYNVAAKAQSSSSSSNNRSLSKAPSRNPVLISKANQKRLQTIVRRKMTNTPMKRHRYRPGTVALREIRR